MKWCVLLLTPMICLACEPKAPEAPATDSPETAAQTAAQEEPARPAWAIEVGGYPALTAAKAERRATPDGGESVNFLGSSAIARLDVRPGGEVYRFNVGYRQEKALCVFDLNAGLGAVTLKMTGDRGEFSGEVLCGPTGSEADRKPTSVKGWFEGPLTRPAKFPPPRDFKPDAKLEITKDGVREKVEEE